MPRVYFTAARIMPLLLLLLTAGFAAEPRRIAVYTPQTNYQVDILLRDGVDYVGVTDLLEPLGRLESRSNGRKLTLIFNGGAAEFQDGKRQYRTSANNKLELPSNFLLIDGRGYVPVASLVQLLPRVTQLTAEFHVAARRLFVASTQFRYAAELRHSPSRLVLTFPVPVNPSTVIEKNRVRLFFRREPVVSNGADNVSYSGDPFLLSSSFAEIPEGAEFIASVSQPATVSIGDGGHTVTIAAVLAPPVGAAAQPASQQAANLAQTASPAPRARPFVILDAAHGGIDSGAVLLPSLLEKTVNLALVRRLQKELEARGVSVVLTRSADTLLTLDQRATSANTSRASLYVALHSSSSGHGVRVYTSMIAPSQPAQTNRIFLPWELAQSPYREKSGSAATALAAECSAEGLPVRTSAAPLRPLNNITLAAVAVEVAPLESSADELGSAEYQQKIATALASAIANLRGKLEAAQ
ncbi:MAG: N-acetylmuramoyl-L-alanine amidase [Candidatus Korobacteraceae bacterium]